MITTDFLFIVYLTVVRLAVAVAGILTIRYGYRLFLAGVFKTSAGGKTEISGRVGEYEFKFATAAPGTCFALFGAALITAVFVANPPRLDRTDKATQTDAAGASRTVEKTEAFRAPDQVFETLAQDAARKRQAGREAEAIGACLNALKVAAPTMNELAELYLGVGRPEDAVVPARLAAIVDPTVPGFQITLEKAQERTRAP